MKQKSLIEKIKRLLKKQKDLNEANKTNEAYNDTDLFLKLNEKKENVSKAAFRRAIQTMMADGYIVQNENLQYEYKPKRNKDGKIQDRIIKITKILQNQSPLSYQTIFAILNEEEHVGKSSLSDALKKMVADEIVMKDEKGLYHLLSPTILSKRLPEPKDEPEESVEASSTSDSMLEPTNLFPKLKKLMFRRWLILYILRGSKVKMLNAKEVHKKMNEYTEVETDWSFNTIYKDLKDLIDLGIVQEKRGTPNTFTLTDEAPLITKVATSQLESFMLLYKTGILNDETLRITDRIRLIAKVEDSLIENYGKTNHIPPRSKKNLEKLLSLPYQKKKIKVTGIKSKEPITVAVGLIFYNYEKNDFYIAGRIKGRNKKQVWVKKLETVSDITVDPVNDNDFYGSQEFLDYKNEMLGMDYEKPIQIELAFRNGPETKMYVESLKQSRKASDETKIIFGETEILYQDNVPGINYIKRFLRMMGPDVRVTKQECNQKLFEEMNDTFQKVESKYQEFDSFNITPGSFVPINDHNIRVDGRISKLLENEYDRITLLLSILGSGETTINEIRDQFSIPEGVLCDDIAILLRAPFFRANLLVNNNYPIYSAKTSDSFKEGKRNNTKIYFDLNSVLGKREYKLLPLTQEEAPWIEHWIQVTEPVFYTISSQNADDTGARTELEEKLHNIAAAIRNKKTILFNYESRKNILAKPVALKYDSVTSIITCECLCEGMQYYDLGKMDIQRYNDIRSVNLKQVSHQPDIDWDTIWGSPLFDDDGLKCENVKILIHHIGEGNNLYKKISSDIANRKYASLKRNEDNVYLYEDKVSGFHFFRQWVRSYGSCFTVLEPKWLAEEVISDFRKMKLQNEMNGFID